MCIKYKNEQKTEDVITNLTKRLENLPLAPAVPWIQDFTLGQKSVISSDFNKSSFFHKLMSAFSRAQPQYRRIQREINGLQRRLCAIRKNAPVMSLNLAP